MAAPTIVSTSPAANANSVVLGVQIEIVFDQAVKPSSLSSRTFALFGPGQTSLIDATNLIVQNPTALTGREYLAGTFSFPSAATVRFTPAAPLRPNVTYTVIVAGANGALVASAVTNTADEPLAESYSFQFTTGEIAGAIPPPSSPLDYTEANLPWDLPALTAEDIELNLGPVPS